MNSDGAGSYLVIWRIEKGTYKDRLVAYGFKKNYCNMALTIAAADHNIHTGFLGCARIGV